MSGSLTAFTTGALLTFNGAIVIPPSLGLCLGLAQDVKLGMVALDVPPEFHAVISARS
jgi:hypothetical protein